MTLSEARTLHPRLVEEIRQHDHRYYVLAQPTISDQEYDRLYRRLVDVEKEFPALVTPDSPTQRVSDRPIKAFKPVRHRQPLLSLDNTYSQEELGEFANRAGMLRMVRRFAVISSPVVPSPRVAPQVKAPRS